jgi:protein-S-isoprenylcysteine O-methyltransferase Ste14
MRKLAAVVIVAAAFVVAGSAHSQASVNALFIVTAPKTEILIGAERIATRGVGLTIAMVAGIVLIASGLLMLISGSRQAPASVERGAADMLVG